MVDYEVDGKRRRISTGTKVKSEAQKRAREIILGIDVPPAPSEAPPKPGSSASRGATLGDVFDMCQRGNGPWSVRNAKSQATIRSNLRVLEPLIGATPVAEVTYRRLEELQTALLDRGYAAATVKRKMDMVGRALTYAVTQAMIVSRPPIPSLRVDNGRTRVLMRDEEELLFRLIEERIEREPARQWTRFKHLMRWLIDTGCRLGELLQAQPGWIESHKGRPVLHIPAWSTKTNKARVIPLSSACVESLSYLRITATNGRLFDMRAAGVWYLFSNIKDEAEAKHGKDWKEIVLHTMRHTCITRLLQGGMPLHKASKWAGHANVKITAGTYGHLEVGDLFDGLDIIDESAPARPHLSAVNV